MPDASLLKKKAGKIDVSLVLKRLNERNEYFCQQLRHRVAGRDVRKEPERVLQVGQQAHVRVRERRLRARLQMLDGIRCVSLVRSPARIWSALSDL